MFNGSSGCVPVMAKYGEQSIHLRNVIWSAQKMEYAMKAHFKGSLLVALYKTCLILK